MFYQGLEVISASTVSTSLGVDVFGTNGGIVLENDARPTPELSLEDAPSEEVKACSEAQPPGLKVKALKEGRCTGK